MSKKIQPRIKNPFERKEVHLLSDDLRSTIPTGGSNAKGKKEEKNKNVLKLNAVVFK